MATKVGKGFRTKEYLLFVKGKVKGKTVSEEKSFSSEEEAIGQLKQAREKHGHPLKFKLYKQVPRNKIKSLRSMT